MAVGIPLGPYRLVRRLASGGMAEIFLARQEGKDGFARDLVVKRILPHLAADPEFTRMFRDEARLAALLSHPNVVHVYDFGSEPDAEGEVLWLAMELVRGVDLRALIVRAVEANRAAGLGGGLPPHHAAKVVSFVCEALAHAHSLRVDGKPAGVVHRDVTPSNVLVSFDGAVKLADFGIAKARTGGKRREATEHGVVKGKLAYLSPEQARGEALDARSDLFNVGILLFEAIRGTPLFPHDDFRRAKMLSAAGKIPEPERIERLPPALARVVTRALAPRREDRYPDALSLRADLESYLRTCPEPSDTVEIGRYVRRHFPDVLEEDARAPRAAGTVVSRIAAPSGSRPPGTEALPPSGTTSLGPPSGTQPIPDDLDGPPVDAGDGDDEDADELASTVVAPPPAGFAALPPPPWAKPRTGSADAHDPSGRAVYARAPAPGGPSPFAPAPSLPGAAPRVASAALEVTAAPPGAPRTTRARTRAALAIAAATVAVASLAGAAIVLTAPGASGAPDAPDVPPAVPPPLPSAPTVTAPAPAAQLRVTSDPPGHALFVDARPVGPTPLVLAIAPGAHRVEVRDERGALLASDQIELEPAEVRELALAVPRGPETASLRVETTPPGATVRVDGAIAGTTPLLAEVEPGRHRVRVELEGYEPAGNEVELVRAGEQSTIAFALTRVPAAAEVSRGAGVRRGGATHRGSSGGSGAARVEAGALTIATTPWSEVYLGARHLGTTPLANVSLPAGTHVLTLRAPDRPPQRTSVTIRAGETTRVRLVL